MTLEVILLLVCITDVIQASQCISVKFPLNPHSFRRRVSKVTHSPCIQYKQRKECKYLYLYANARICTGALIISDNLAVFSQVCIIQNRDF